MVQVQSGLRLSTKTGHDDGNISAQVCSQMNKSGGKSSVNLLQTPRRNHIPSLTGAIPLLMRMLPILPDMSTPGIPAPSMPDGGCSFVGDDDLGLGLILEFEIEPHAKELFILICSAEFAHFLEITNMLIKFS